MHTKYCQQQFLTVDTILPQCNAQRMNKQLASEIVSGGKTDPKNFLKNKNIIIEKY